MKVGLIDVDGHNFPNIPLMKLSAWHKSRGDRVEWYSPLLSGHCDKVYMSKVFSFTPDYNWIIDADEIKKGGSGYCISLEGGREVYDKSKDGQLPSEIEHIYPDYGLYNITDTAYGFITRGCPRACGFCHVAAKEGRRSYKAGELQDFWKGQSRIVLCDPNILAYNDHGAILEELADTKATIEINQGLDIRLITDRDIDQFKRIKLDKVHFAYDRIQDRAEIEPRIEAFIRETGYNRSRGRALCYILVNYDTTLEQDIERIEFCRRLDVQPYPMIYDKEHAASIYKRLQRYCNNNIFWGLSSFDEYL